MELKSFLYLHFAKTKSFALSTKFEAGEMKISGFAKNLKTSFSLEIKINDYLHQFFCQIIPLRESISAK